MTFLRENVIIELTNSSTVSAASLVLCRLYFWVTREQSALIILSLVMHIIIYLSHAQSAKPIGDGHVPSSAVE